MLGLGFLRNSDAVIFVRVFWFLVSIFQKNGMFEPVFAQIFGAQIFAPIWRRLCVCRFLRPFLRRFLCRFSVDIFSTFWRLKNVFQSHTKLRRKSTEKSAASHGPAGGGTPFHLHLHEQTARHTIAVKPKCWRRARERKTCSQKSAKDPLCEPLASTFA